MWERLNIPLYWPARHGIVNTDIPHHERQICVSAFGADEPFLVFEGGVEDADNAEEFITVTFLGGVKLFVVKLVEPEGQKACQSVHSMEAVLCRGRTTKKRSITKLLAQSKGLARRLDRRTTVAKDIFRRRRCT